MVVAAVPVVLIVVVPVTTVEPKIVFVELELPIPSVVELVVPRLIVPAPVVLRVNVPVPLARTVKPVLVVLAPIIGLAPEKVKAVELNVLPLYVPLALMLPVRVMPPLPPCRVVREVPLVEPKVVLWSVALLAKPQVVLEPHCTFTVEAAPVVPIVIVPPKPWLSWMALLTLPPWMRVTVFAVVFPTVTASEPALPMSGRKVLVPVLAPPKVSVRVPEPL